MKESYLMMLLEKTSLIVVLFLLISKLKIFKSIFEKEDYDKKDLFVISAVFTLLSIIGTYNGIVYKGSILNTRIITIVSGGILFGPFVSIPAGIISGLHRFLMHSQSMTAVPCFISSISAGILSGLFYKKIPAKFRVIYGILVGMVSENITIILIYFLATPRDLALDIIHTIYLPLIVGQLGIGFMVSIVNTIEKDKRDIEERKKAEMSALQRQINPHFIFNALNTIA
ncbi:MAG: histidine kinase, partial [Intestinibacter sp.]|uniref:LytS/YhcK type 5TM receptor domain-containing protein n=1 Tax=Intestinibacter sp. TaxID=1965304 RepID=UPI0025BD7424